MPKVVGTLICPHVHFSIDSDGFTGWEMVNNFITPKGEELIKKNGLVGKKVEFIYPEMEIPEDGTLVSLRFVPDDTPDSFEE